MTRTDWLFVSLAAAWVVAFAHIAIPAPDRYAVASGSAASQVAAGLADAVRDGDIAAVRSLVRADVNAREADESTPLHWAVYHSDHEAADLLIARGADVSARSREGETPLSLAAVNGDEEMIRRLLEAGADVDERRPNGETPLMLASRTGDVAAIGLLLDRGADIDAAEQLRGTTALMWAAANRNVDAVRLLLARGADPSLRSANARMGRGPYLAPTARSRINAYRVGYLEDGEEVSRVQRLRARASFLDEDARTELQEILSQGEEEAEIPAEEDDPLGEDDLEADFLEQVMEVDDAPGGGLTALVFAAREGDHEIARALIEAGADINQATNYGWTPLLTAVQNRYYQLAAYFLDEGADPNLANKGGWSPLYIATDNRNIEGGDYPTRMPDMDHLEMIRRLLEHGADPNLRMASSTETRTVFTNQWLHEEGATPFLRAAQSGDVALMRLLLEHGADPHIATEAGVTPLMVASGIGWVEGITYEWSPEETHKAVELLIELGADVNAHDDVDGRTALMGAAHKGRNDVIELLVAHGADLSARDVGSRDSVHGLYGARWQAVDYADGLVRIGVQSAIPQPETGALLRRLMRERGLEIPPEGRTLDSICITEICQPPT